MMEMKIGDSRKKKIKTLLGRMGKQNERFLPVTPPLVEMMDMTATDEELDYLLGLGAGLYSREQMAKFGDMAEERFEPFLDALLRKGLLHVETDRGGKQKYRLNAIAVGWYEVMMHFLMGKPEQKAFSEKWHKYFALLQKLTRLNVGPFRGLQNLVERRLHKSNQGAAIIDPATKGKKKGKTISINTEVAPPDSRIYPNFFINELVDEYGDQKAIAVFPCVCRHGSSLLGHSCMDKMPKESCILFAETAKAWVSFGYGRMISKAEAMDILKEVRDRGAVHTIMHERDDPRLPVVAICNCCWDCCGLLKSYNMGAMGLKYNSHFQARIKGDADCKACGVCERFCPTTAISLRDGKAVLNGDICIGCGQCAYQCKDRNIELVPLEREVFLPALKPSQARIKV